MSSAGTPTEQPDTSRLERALLALAPALEERRVAGLLLRSARGLLPAANSAIPGLGPVAGDPQSQLQAAEHFFAAAHQPTQWLVGQRSANADLEALLLETGFRRTQTRVIWCRNCCRNDSYAPISSSATVRRETDPARFARSYGRLAHQPETAVRLQILRLRALAQRNPMALLTVGRDNAAEAAIEGCLIALVDRAVGEPEAAHKSPGRIGLLSDLLVAAEARRSGLGSQLLAVAEHWFGQQGCDWIALEASADNHIAPDFYHQHGFTIAGRWSFLRTPPKQKTGRLTET